MRPRCGGRSSAHEVLLSSLYDTDQLIRKNRLCHKSSRPDPIDRIRIAGVWRRPKPIELERSRIISWSALHFGFREGYADSHGSRKVRPLCTYVYQEALVLDVMINHAMMPRSLQTWERNDAPSHVGDMVCSIRHSLSNLFK